MLIEDFIIAVYCAIEDGLAALPVAKLRTRGFLPKLSDAETLMLEMAGAYLGYKDDKSIWRYFRLHWQAWFPQLGSRSNFVRQSASLWKLKQMLHRHWVNCLGATGEGVYLVDGFPVPVCHFRRANFSKVLKGGGSLWPLRIQGDDVLWLQGNAAHQCRRGDWGCGAGSSHRGRT